MKAQRKPAKPSVRRKCRHPRTTEQTKVERLVCQHLTWSRQLARQALRILPASVDIDDLAGPAASALLAAAETYRDDHLEPPHSKPVEFRAYARPRVYFSCLMACRRKAYRDAMMQEIPEGLASCQDLEAEGRTLELRRLLLQARTGDGNYLTEQEQQVIGLYYEEGLTFQEIADQMGYSQAWVSEIHSAALGKMREWFERRGVHSVEDVL